MGRKGRFKGLKDMSMWEQERVAGIVWEKVWKRVF